MSHHYSSTLPAKRRGRPKLHINEEERRQARRRTQSRYHAKYVLCKRVLCIHSDPWLREGDAINTHRRRQYAAQSFTHDKQPIELAEKRQVMTTPTRFRPSLTSSSPSSVPPVVKNQTTD